MSMYLYCTGNGTKPAATVLSFPDYISQFVSSTKKRNAKAASNAIMYKIIFILISEIVG